MTDAEVLQQVRDARDAYARSHGYDLDAMSADLRAKAAAGGRQVVRLPPRRPTLSPEQREALSVLAEVWALSPEVRLGQLVAHLELLSEANVGKGLGYLEDDELTAVLNRHREELKARLEVASK